MFNPLDVGSYRGCVFVTKNGTRYSIGDGDVLSVQYSPDSRIPVEDRPVIDGTEVELLACIPNARIGDVPPTSTYNRYLDVLGRYGEVPDPATPQRLVMVIERGGVRHRIVTSHLTSVEKPGK